MALKKLIIDNIDMTCMHAEIGSRAKAPVLRFYTNVGSIFFKIKRKDFRRMQKKGQARLAELELSECCNVNHAILGTMIYDNPKGLILLFQFNTDMW